ncbi:MAG: Wide host range VirA protein [Syntrophorhabdaceae bacterium PtaU1.Bin034]|nr:MAG: Wide host range VirA protein [Syntrophorhabdaceae bacterium PtaU1.Bin034]
MNRDTRKKGSAGNIHDPLRVRTKEEPAEQAIMEQRIDQLETSLRESEERYLAFADSTFEGFVWSEDGYVVGANEQFARMHGYDLSEVIGRPLTDFVVPEEREKLTATLTGGEAIGEWRALRKDRSELIVEVHGKTVERAGRLICMASIRDITERKQAEEAVRQAHAELEARVIERTAELITAYRRLHSILESITDSFFSVDRQWQFTYCNKNFERALGKSCEDIIGKRIWETFAYTSEFRYRCERAMKEDKPASFRFFSSFTHKWVDVRLYPSEDGLSAYLQDVTDQVKGEEARRTAEEFLQKVMDTLPVGVWVFDAHGKIIRCNPAGEQIWGGVRYVGMEGYGEYKAWWTATGEAVKQEERSGWRAIVKGETTLNKEMDIETFDGKHKIVAHSAVPVLDEQGKVMGAVIVDEDITEKKQKEEELRQAHKMQAIGTLAGGIAHDFNNILAIILGNTELALDSVGPGDPTYHRLEQSLKACIRAKSLVQQILTFSRKVEPERKPVRLAPLVRETFALLRATLPATIDMSLNLQDEEGTIIADSQLIQQILMNLVANARDAINDRRGSVEITVAAVNVGPEKRLYSQLPAGQYMMLSVRDTGSGMDEQVVKRMFEPFFTTKKIGHGMGLAVVHGIVESHKGTITVESRPDKGTAIRIFFPRAATQQDAVEKRSLSPNHGIGKTILFVDDEEQLVTAARSTLSQLGYHMVTETDPIMALKIFLEDPGRFDLVITDQTMPHMTGMELARELLDIRPAVPIILCTGYSEAVSPGLAHSEGIDAVLMKPIQRSELTGAIDRVFGGSEEARV